MADDDDWESAWDSGAAEARLAAETKEEDPEKIRKKNKQLWNAAETPAPQLHYTLPQRTEYKPDLKILKRPTQSPSPQPVVPVLTKQEEEALRIERLKKYEQTKERIFGTPSPGPSTSTATTTASAAEKKVWEPSSSSSSKEGKEKGVLPIRVPKGPNEGKGFARGRGRGDN